MSTIVVENVSKIFKLPHEKRKTLFHNLIGVIKMQFDYEEFWALSNISFEIEKGETFGIIGRNGSGKSTLLKVLAKVLFPDSGSVTTNGKVASFLELGVGFQPELTAQENVYLYCSILGMSRKDARRQYDSIFQFAELGNFQNMKLKNFSSGMFLRLAFSTAVHATPDILLIDEVFAVGDEAFQTKCAGKIAEFQKQGKTMVFVSHALPMVEKLCQRSMLVDNGKMITIGDTGSVINQYRMLTQKVA